MDDTLNNFAKRIVKNVFMEDRITKLSKKIGKSEEDIQSAIESFDWDKTNIILTQVNTSKSSSKSSSTSKSSSKKDSTSKSSSSKSTSSKNKELNVKPKTKSIVKIDLHKIKEKIEEAKEKDKYYCFTGGRLIKDGPKMREKYIFDEKNHIAYAEDCPKYEKFKNLNIEDDDNVRDNNVENNNEEDEENNRCYKSDNGNWIDENNYVYDITDECVYGKEVDDLVKPLTDKDVKFLESNNIKYRILSDNELKETTAELSLSE